MNNILCSGATPRYLSVGFLIEEGFALADLRQIAAAVSDAARFAEVEIAACDFKVVKRCATGGICLTAACIGELPPDIDLSPENIRCGDKILISGDIGRHAAAVASLNEGEATLFDTISDTASLGDIVHNLLDVCGNDIRVLGLLSEGGGRRNYRQAGISLRSRYCLRPGSYSCNTRCGSGVQSVLHRPAALFKRRCHHCRYTGIARRCSSCCDAAQRSRTKRCHNRLRCRLSDLTLFTGFVIVGQLKAVALKHCIVLVDVVAYCC